MYIFFSACWIDLHLTLSRRNWSRNVWLFWRLMFPFYPGLGFDKFTLRRPSLKPFVCHLQDSGRHITSVCQGLSSPAPRGGKMRDPGNEVVHIEMRNPLSQSATQPHNLQKTYFANLHLIHGAKTKVVKVQIDSTISSSLLRTLFPKKFVGLEAR